MSIDAVITWVDGADPAHRARLDAYLSGLAGSRPATAHSTRFSDIGEIDYCVASILRYAPWLQRIHIVSDAQTPRLVETLRGTPYADRVRVVDHREIFAGFEQHLPTFNSRAIISLLWRIPGLNEDFVYFNDDMLLLREVAPADFFRDGRIVLRGEWRSQSSRGAMQRIKALSRRLRGVSASRVGNLDAQQASARLAGFEDRYYRLFHNPYPMRRSTLEAFFARRPELLAGNVRHRLRSNEQFKTEVLATHLAIASDDAILDNRLHTVQLKPSEQWLPRMRHKMRRADADPHAAFLVVQSLEMASPETRQTIFDWLDRRVGTLDAWLSGATGLRSPRA